LTEKRILLCVFQNHIPPKMLKKSIFKAEFDKKGPFSQKSWISGKVGLFTGLTHQKPENWPKKGVRGGMGGKNGPWGQFPYFPNRVVTPQNPTSKLTPFSAKIGFMM
jgi:hypothetical protein